MKKGNQTTARKLKVCRFLQWFIYQSIPFRVYRQITWPRIKTIWSHVPLALSLSFSLSFVLLRRTVFAYTSFILVSPCFFIALEFCSIRFWYDDRPVTHFIQVPVFWLFLLIWCFFSKQNSLLYVLVCLFVKYNPRFGESSAVLSLPVFCVNIPEVSIVCPFTESFS